MITYVAGDESAEFSMIALYFGQVHYHHHKSQRQQNIKTFRYTSVSHIYHIYDILMLTYTLSTATNITSALFYSDHPLYYV